MPSLDHELLLELFRDRPPLATRLLRESLHVSLPEYSDVILSAADLGQSTPTEYRADLVLVLQQADDPVLGVILEIQRQIDAGKRWSWPVYVTSLRARLRCPVCLLVLAGSEAVARWAREALELGAGNRFVPQVLALTGVPEVTEEAQALHEPHWAVLSAIAHGQDSDAAQAARIAERALQASLQLDAEQATLYYDWIETSLSEEARRILETIMQTRKYEYRSEFAKRYLAEGETKGRDEGRTEGRVALLSKQLCSRFGALPPAAQQALQSASIEELDAIAERVLTAKSWREALGLP